MASALPGSHMFGVADVTCCCCIEFGLKSQD